MRSFHRTSVPQNPIPPPPVVEKPAPLKISYDEFSDPEDFMDGIDVNPEVEEVQESTEMDSKDWYNREEELHATEEDLKELEAKDYVCDICNAPFPSRAELLQHSFKCGTPDSCKFKLGNFEFVCSFIELFVSVFHNY